MHEGGDNFRGSNNKRLESVRLTKKSLGQHAVGLRGGEDAEDEGAVAALGEAEEACHDGGDEAVVGGVDEGVGDPRAPHWDHPPTPQRPTKPNSWPARATFRMVWSTGTRVGRRAAQQAEWDTKKRPKSVVIILLGIVSF